MKKSTIWGIIVLVLVVIIVAVSGKSGSKSKVTSNEPIKIGLSLPLTGDLSFIGEADKNAAQLALADINSNPNNKHTYQLLFEDDAFDAQKAASAANKLINVDKVNALVSVGSTAGNSISPIAEAAKIPHFGTASDANVAKGEYNLTDWTQPKEEVTKLIQELTRRKITKVAMIEQNQQGVAAIDNDFKNRAPAAGIQVVGAEQFNQGTKDFRTSISKLQKLNPDIYFIGAFDPEIGLIAKQIHDLGIKTPLVSVESFGLSSDAKPFEGQWYVDAASATSAFSDLYQKTYGKPAGPAAANVYDELHLLVNGFESAQGEVTSDKVVTYLNKASGYSGAMGLLTPSDDGIFRSEASVKMIRDGKPVLVDTTK